MKGGDNMCYNCGCGLPNEDHGKGHAGVDPAGKAITDQTFLAAGKAFEMEEQTSKRNTMELLEKNTLAKPDSPV